MQQEKPDLSTSPRAIWRLTWPQMLTMLAVFLMSFTPVWTAGRIGSDVQGALGMATQCSFFLTVVCMALSSGATSAVSQAIGALRMRRAHRYMSTTVLLSFVLGTATGAAGFLFAGEILRLFQIPASIRPMATDIWKIFLYGLPFQYVYHATGILFRSTRRVVTPLVVASCITVVHAVLCIGTGLGVLGLPELGWRGIAWAGTIAPVIGAVVNCTILCRDGILRRCNVPTLAWLSKGLPYLVRVAVPAGLASLVWHSGYLVLFILVGTVPVESVQALAGLTGGLRIEAILFMPGMAFHMSAAVLVGNCLGHGDKDEAYRVSRTLIRSAVVLMTVVGLAMWPFRTDLAAMISRDAATQLYVISYLTYNLISTPFSIASTVLGGVMIGAGATRYNLIVYGGSFWAVRIPLGYALGHILWGTADGVFCAMLVSQVIQTLAMLWVFASRRWTNFAMRANVVPKQRA